MGRSPHHVGHGAGGCGFGDFYCGLYPLVLAGWQKSQSAVVVEMSEWTVFTICMLPLLCAGWMLFAGLAHPV